MKRIIGILLLSLLGFLGCSDGDDATNTIGEAIPVAPFGLIYTETPTYEWTPVPGATRYQLLVEDTSETAIIEDVYTAEEAGCEAEGAMCNVTPAYLAQGEYTWQVMACAYDLNGSWSQPMDFSCDLTPEGGSPSFVAIGNGTVVDLDKLIMWQQDGTRYHPKTAANAKLTCESSELGGYNDWRLPYVSELWSLFKDNHAPSNPYADPLPTFPFYHWIGHRFWTCTPYYFPGMHYTVGTLFDPQYADETVTVYNYNHMGGYDDRPKHFFCVRIATTPTF